MWNVVKQILVSPAGSFASVFGLVVLVGWFMFWLHGRFVLLIANHKALSDACADTKSHADNACDRLDKRIEALRDDMHEVKGEIQYIKSTLNSILNAAQTQNSQTPFVKAHSPLSLTESGLAASKEMNLDLAVATNWESIKNRMDAEIADKNPYDIQTYCLEKIPVNPESYLDSASLERMKLYAFRNGRTLFDCLKVVGILVRDAYFKAHGIPIESLDAPRPPAAK